MPYIKISDPNVIDLAAWQQVINVVNQHSDSITAITNNFGIQGTAETQWNGALDLANQYDPATQKIIYGRVKIDTSTAQSTTGDHVFYGDVLFTDNESGTTVFDAKPIITVTPYFSGQDDNPPSITNANVVATVIAVTEEKFTYRVTNARSTTTTPVPLTQFFYLNWMAIGPKS